LDNTKLQSIASKLTGSQLDGLYKNDPNKIKEIIKSTSIPNLSSMTNFQNLIDSYNASDLNLVHNDNLNIFANKLTSAQLNGLTISKLQFIASKLTGIQLNNIKLEYIADKLTGMQLSQLDDTKLKAILNYLVVSQLNDTSFTKLTTIIFELSVDKIADLNNNKLEEIVNKISIDDLCKFVISVVLSPIYSFHLDNLSFFYNSKNIKLTTLNLNNNLSLLNFYHKFKELLTKNSIEDYYYDCSSLFSMFTGASSEVAFISQLYTSRVEEGKGFHLTQWLLSFNYDTMNEYIKQSKSGIFDTVNNLIFYMSQNSGEPGSLKSFEYKTRKSVLHFMETISNNFNNIQFNDNNRQKILDIIFSVIDYYLNRVLTSTYNTANNSPANNWTFPTDSKYNNKRKYTWNTDGTLKSVTFDNTSIGYFQDRKIMCNMLQIAYYIIKYQYISKYQADPTLTTYDDSISYNPSYTTISNIFNSKKDIISLILTLYNNIVLALNPDNQPISGTYYTNQFNKYNTLINTLKTKIDGKTA